MEAAILEEQLIIGGDRVAAESGSTTTILSPVDHAPLARVADAAAADAGRAVDVAHAASRGEWRRISSRDRGKLLLRIASLIRDDAEELARLEAQNVGKPIREARDEVALAADCFEYYAGAIDKIGGSTIPVAARGTGLTFREPIGVCALIVPWNFPIAITSWKLAPALAMGNTVVIKPAGQTPLTAFRLAEVALAAGIPPGVVNVVTGSGSVIGEALVTHPLVRKVAFTGSTEVGTRVMKLAADDIKRVTLELGGKSANLIFADADLERAIPSAMSSVLGNAGQDCCARSRLLVDRAVYQRVLDGLGELFGAVRLGDPLDEATEMGPLVTNAHRERVLEFADRGRSEGAVLVCGGEVPTEEPLGRGSYMRPAIFAEVTPEMTIFKEEIFGPVLAVTPFDSEDEAITLANATLYGLSGSIWTRDIGRALRVARAVEAGVLSINSGSSVHLEAPFGGVKRSGIGRELGLAALDHYSELKSVFISDE